MLNNLTISVDFGVPNLALKKKEKKTKIQNTKILRIFQFRERGRGELPRH